MKGKLKNYGGVIRKKGNCLVEISLKRAWIYNTEDWRELRINQAIRKHVTALQTEESLPVPLILNICRSCVHLPAPINTSESHQYISSTTRMIYPYLFFCHCVTTIYLTHYFCNEIYSRGIATINMGSNTFLLPFYWHKNETSN